MKFLNIVLVSLALAAPVAKAASIDVDVTGAKYSLTSIGSDSQTTTSAFATGAGLPNVKWNLEGYSLLANLATGDIGAQLNVCPGLQLGLTGGASTKTAGGTETHDNHATAFAKLLTKNGNDTLELKPYLSRQEAVGGTINSSAAGLTATYFVGSGLVSPYAAADYNYAWAVPSDDSKQTASLSLGVRARLK